jgi:hypothetical protein
MNGEIADGKKFDGHWRWYAARVSPLQENNGHGNLVNRWRIRIEILEKGKPNGLQQFFLIGLDPKRWYAQMSLTKAGSRFYSGN